MSVDLTDLEGPVSLDLGDISDEPVAKGWHTVEIERAEARLSSQAQVPQLFIMARIVDEADPEYNRTLVWNLNLTGDGRIFLKRCLTALGMPQQLDYPSYQDLADDLIGRQVDAQVKHGTWKGEKRADVNKWREPALDIEL